MNFIENLPSHNLPAMPSIIENHADLAPEHEIQSSKRSGLEQIQHEDNAINRVSEERISIMEAEAPVTSDGSSRFRSFAIMSGLCVSQLIQSSDFTIHRNLTRAVRRVCLRLESNYHGNSYSNHLP
jgi:hypothetical protein